MESEVVGLFVFSYIRIIDNFRLGKVRFESVRRFFGWPHRVSREATVKIRRNPQLWILPIIQLSLAVLKDGKFLLSLN